MIGRGGENGTGFPYAGICVVKLNKFHAKKLSGIENLLKAIDTVGKSCYHSIVKQPETLPERFPAKPVRERGTEYDVTIKDIARLSGVSVSTVSRVLNNRPDVSDENRRRVRAIIESSNYIPNNSARDLVRTKSDAIGLVVRGRSNPFYTDIIRAIEQGITERGYTMVMQQIGTSDDEVKRAAVMEREKRLRGLILLGGRSDYTPAEVALLNVPFVCCSYSNHYGTLRDEMYSSVSIEDEEEAYRAVMELYRRGHRRIAALVSRPDDRSIRATPGHWPTAACRSRRGWCSARGAMTSVTPMTPRAARSIRARISRRCSPSPTTWPSARCARCTRRAAASRRTAP